MSDYTKLRELAEAATPQNIDSAQRIEHYEDGSHIECPACGGEGSVALEADFCNYDQTAIGVQFYGIGNEFGAAEAYFRAATPANIIALIDEHAALSQRVAELQSVNFDHDLMVDAQKERIAELERNGWQPIETAPEGRLLVVCWLDKDDPDNPERHAFDFIEDGGWVKHNEDYDHFLCVAPPGSIGPSADAPYTHWLNLPVVPVAAQANKGEEK